jgi:hypothetical protein
MIHMEDLRKILKLVLLTGNLKKVKPVSLLIVSKSGNGKTELITSFKKSTLAFVTDMSYMGLLSILEKEPQLKHIIVPDFIKITQKKKATSDHLISLFNALIEEGVGKIRVYQHEADFKNRTCGLVTATTQASFSQRKNIWQSFGFVQRMIIISFDYSDDTINLIMDSINKEEYLKYYQEKLINVKGTEIASERALNKQLNPHVDKNFRSLKNLQSLCKAHALMNKRSSVNQSDVTEIIRLTKYMNLKYTKI